MTLPEIDGLRRHLRQALADVLEMTGASRSERDHALFGALVRLEWSSTALLDALQVHAGQLERLGSDATADARTLLATTRALSALVAAVADSADRRLDAVETRCELLVRHQRHEKEPARQ
jgi:hypothetical protein